MVFKALKIGLLKNEMAYVVQGPNTVPFMVHISYSEVLAGDDSIPALKNKISKALFTLNENDIELEFVNSLFSLK